MAGEYNTIFIVATIFWAAMIIYTITVDRKIRNLEKKILRLSSE